MKAANIKSGLMHVFIGSNGENCRMPAHFAKLTTAVVLSLTAGVVSSLAQTTILVVRSSTEIVAGSDSKGVSPEGESAILCKVHRIGNIFWSASGFVPEDNLREMTNFLGSQNPSFRQMVERSSTYIPSQLQTLLDDVRGSSPTEYQKIIQMAKNGLDVTFFGMEKNVPMVGRVRFILPVDSTGRMVVRLLKDPMIVDGTSCPGDAVCAVVTGHYEHISSELAGHHWPMDKATDIRMLIQTEIDADPAVDGPPIRILRIDSNGPRWVQNGDGCNLEGIPTEKKKTPEAKK